MSWTQRGGDIDGEAIGDSSGYSVSISSDGNIVAIGAILNDNPSGTSIGQVRVYAWNGSEWKQRGDDIDGEAPSDNSGWSVSLSADGRVVAIGAPNNDNPSGSNIGHVRIYAWNGLEWKQRGGDIDGEAPSDSSGWSVSLSADGTIVAIGAPNNDNALGSNIGQVRVYAWNGAEWKQRGGDIDGEAPSDNSGWSVSLSANGNVVAIGAPSNDNTSGSNIGQVRVYAWNGSEWKQRGNDIDGKAPGDQSGYSVSLSANGCIVAIGAPNNDNTSGSNSGHVRVYTWDGSEWKQRGGDINGEAPSDNSGWSVSLSANGTIVAIGALNNDGTSGSNRGHVRIYAWDGSEWKQRGGDIDGEAPLDNSGLSVSISADGSVVAIGAPYNDNPSGSSFGHTRVYAYPVVSTSNVATIQSSSERLRRLMEIQPKIIAPRPIRDSSMVTQRVRFAASRRLPGWPRRAGGSNIIPSSEYFVSASAGCAVCLDLSQNTVTTACCPDNYNPSPAPAALLPRCTTCGVPSGPEPLPLCCPTSRVNTWYATDIDPTTYTQPTCNPCVVPAQPQPDCCDENGFLRT
jgi:hypothetical protein